MNSMIKSAGRLVVAGSAVVLAGCNAVEDVVDQPTIAAPVQTAVLQGTVSGLSTRRPVVLQNNGVSECLSRDDPGVPEGTLVECRYFGTQGQDTVSFSMGAKPVGTPYNITVKNQPFGKVCTVANGTGTVGTAGAAAVSVSCQNDPAVQRFAVSGTIAPAVANMPGAKIILTTEDGVREIPAAGLSTFTFPDAIFDSQISLPIFTWRVTATFTENGVVNNCNVANGTNDASGGAVSPTGPVSNVQVTACTFPVNLLVAYSAASGQPALTMPAGGMALALRHHRTGEDVQTIEVPAYSSSTVRTFPEVRSNPDAIYELVVARQPAGHTCIVGSSSQYQWGSVVLLLNPADTTHAWNANLNRNVRCRASPAAPAQLQGTFQQATVTADSPTPVANRNFLTFFEDGTYLYGAHGSGVNAFTTSGVEHGFYAYNTGAGTITFNPHTDTSGTNGLSTVSGGASGNATLTNVVRVAAGRPEIHATSGTTNWVLTEPLQIEGQLTGAWATADRRRVFVFNYSTYAGFHMGVNGQPNLQDGCFNIEDPTALTGYYTRRGNATTCSLGSGMYTIDMPSATGTTPRLAPGFSGRWPASGSNADGRPSSPVNYAVAPGAPDTLTVQETLNGQTEIDGRPIHLPVVLQRLRAN